MASNVVTVTGIAGATGERRRRRGECWGPGTPGGGATATNNGKATYYKNYSLAYGGNGGNGGNGGSGAFGAGTGGAAGYGAKGGYATAKTRSASPAVTSRSVPPAPRRAWRPGRVSGQLRLRQRRPRELRRRRGVATASAKVTNTGARRRQGRRALLWRLRWLWQPRIGERGGWRRRGPRQQYHGVRLRPFRRPAGLRLRLPDRRVRWGWRQWAGGRQPAAP